MKVGLAAVRHDAVTLAEARLAVARREGAGRREAPHRALAHVGRRHARATATAAVADVGAHVDARSRAERPCAGVGANVPRGRGVARRDVGGGWLGSIGDREVVRSAISHGEVAGDVLERAIEGRRVE